MAKLPMPVTAPTEGKAEPGTYWKAGTAKKPVQVVIEARVVREGQEAGPTVGKFANSVDIPFRLENRPYTATVSTKSESYRELVNNLGPDAEKWIGATILLQDSPTISGAFNVAYVGGP